MLISAKNAQAQSGEKESYDKRQEKSIRAQQDYMQLQKQQDETERFYSEYVRTMHQRPTKSSAEKVIESITLLLQKKLNLTRTWLAARDIVRQKRPESVMAAEDLSNAMTKVVAVRQVLDTDTARAIEKTESALESYYAVRYRAVRTVWQERLVQVLNDLGDIERRVRQGNLKNAEEILTRIKEHRTKIGNMQKHVDTLPREPIAIDDSRFQMAQKEVHNAYNAEDGVYAEIERTILLIEESERQKN